MSWFSLLKIPIAQFVFEHRLAKLERQVSQMATVQAQVEDDIARINAGVKHAGELATVALNNIVDLKTQIATLTAQIQAGNTIPQADLDALAAAANNIETGLKAAATSLGVKVPTD